MVTVRTITDAEVDTLSLAVMSGFHKLAEATHAEFYRPLIETDRSYGAFDGTEMVGTARSYATELTVPGPRCTRVAAVTAVTVRASHRRRGILTEMMRRQLDEIARRGEAVAILIASEAPIYGRFGYGPATENTRIAVAARHLRFTCPTPAGAVRFVDPAGYRAAAPAVYERFRAAQPGAIERRPRWWDTTTGLVPYPGGDPPAFLAVHTDADGTPGGFVHYAVEESWEGRAAASTITIRDLVAATDDAYGALWRFVTGADWIVRVTAGDRPAREPLAEMVEDRRDVHEVDRADFLWVRLLDVPAALAARRYRAADRITLDVVDAFRPASGGRWTIEAGPDGASATATTAGPDLTVTAADLAAAYLGSTPLWPAAACGRVEEHRPGALDAFDRLFGSDRPAWCHTWF